ncbi:MAG: MFS transporter [Bacillota bacterium]
MNLLAGESKISKKNYLFLLFEGICFNIGMVFFDGNTILPLLVEELTGSSILVGLLGMAPAFGMGVTSLIAGNYTRTLPYKKKFIVTFSSTGRLPLWILGLSLLLIPASNPILWALLIIGIQYSFWLADGAVYTAWTDLIGKTVSEDIRGRFFSVTQLLGGGLAIFAGGLISKILNLEFVEFPKNYGLVITIGALCFTGSIIMFSRIRENKASLVSKKEKSLELLKNIPHYLKISKPFSQSIFILFLCTMGTISLPFYITYAKTGFGLAEKQVGIFISLRIIGKFVGGIIFGYIGDKYGHEKSIIIYGFSAFLPGLLALLINPSLSENIIFILFNIIYFFVGIQVGSWMVFMNYMIDLIPANQRTLFAGFLNVVRVPASFAPFIGGLIVSHWSYKPVFILSLIFGLIGTYFSFLLPAAERTSKIKKDIST